MMKSLGCRQKSLRIKAIKHEDKNMIQ